MAVPRCVSRQYIESMIGSFEEYLPDVFNIVSLLDTGLASPFMYSTYQRDPACDSKHPDWQVGHNANLLTLNVDDCHRDNMTHHQAMFGGDARWTYAEFTRNQASRVIHWFLDRSLNNDLPFIAHCYYGYSRSGAIAWWIAQRLGYSIVEFMNTNPQAKPNKEILEALDDEWWHHQHVQPRRS